MEVKARKGKIIAIVSEGDEEVRALADYCIEIPECDEMLVPLLATIPLKTTLLSYCIVAWLQCGSTKESGEISNGGISYI